MTDHMTRVPIGRVCDINPESLPDSTDRDFRFHYVDLSCVQTGRIELPKETITFGEASPRARRKVQEGDVLLSTVRPNLKGFAVVEREHSSAIVSTGFAVLRAKSNTDTRYIYQVLLSDPVMKQMTDSVAGSNYPAITASIVSSLIVPLPSLPEQKAIVTILSTWDRGIRQLTDLIAAKLRIKQGLMQQLLTGQRRFKGFGKPSNDTGQLPEGWKRLKASELFENFTQKKNDNEDLLSVTQDRGVIPRTMLKGKVVMPESGTGGYKLVEPGNFVISLRSFQGGLEYSQYRGLVSPAYTVLKPCQTINDAFFRHYFKSYDFIQRLAVAVIGIRDGKQISYNDFESVKLPKPPIEEQERIAAVLDISDKEVDLLRKQLDSLKQQKKGLMQKLLTGEVRVKLPKGVV